MQAARDNIKDPPGIFVKVGLESLRGTLRFIDDDLPRAFGDLGDLHLLGDLADASTEASTSIGGLRRVPRERPRAAQQGLVPPRARAVRAEAAASTKASRSAPIACWPSPCASCSRRRRSSAASPRASTAAIRWPPGQKAKADHPPAGQLVAGRRSSSSPSSPTSSAASGIVSLPEGAPVAVAADAAVLPLDVRQHVDAGAVRVASAARVLLHHRRRSRRGRPERQDEHLRDFNYGALWSISIHEVFPGHFLHYQHLRQVELDAAQVDPLLVDGVRRRLGALLRADDDRRRASGKNDTGVRLGQLAEALIRLCRCIVGIRLHCEDMSVEQGVRFFRDEAFLEEPSARREAERGTFDPSYILYSAGKLMLLKLREDYKAHVGAKYLAARVSRHAARQRHRADLAAPGADARASRTATCSSSDRSTRSGHHAACTNTSATPARTASRRFRSSRTRSSTSARSAAGHVRKLLSSPAIQFKGSGFYITDYAKKATTGGKLGVVVRLEVGERREERRDEERHEVRQLREVVEVLRLV